jgi:diaminopimelate epimerase
MAEPLAFHKYEGLGNDFVVVDAEQEGVLGSKQATWLCDRHVGIGADGILLVLPPRRPGCDVRMRVINADGSVPEMCGNGIRCVAIHVARRLGLVSGTVRVDTDAGPRRCEVDDGDGAGVVSVEMGAVRVLADRTIEVEGHNLALTLADIGNPHAVLMGAFDRPTVERVGARLAVHSAFPHGTNVEFAHVSPDGVDLVVWERGVGLTLACGTGACAASAVVCAKGLAPYGVPLAVRLPGGQLDVRVESDGRTTMRGPARSVFSGSIPAARPV